MTNGDNVLRTSYSVHGDAGCVYSHELGCHEHEVDSDCRHSVDVLDAKIGSLGPKDSRLYPVLRDELPAVDS